MSFKNIKTTPILLSVSLAALSGITFIPRANAAQLNLQSPLDATEDTGLSVPYTFVDDAPNPAESDSVNSELASFSCNFAPEGSGDEVQPNSGSLSSAKSNLYAQAGTFDIGQIEAPAGQGAIIDETCELDNAPVGGGGPGFNPAFLSPLLAGLIPAFLGGGGDDTPPPVPEPMATPFVFAALGLGGILVRKRLKSSDSSKNN